MKVTEDVYALDATKGTYAYIILGPKPMMVDTGVPFQGERMLKELAAMKIDPQSIQDILLTHHDADHIGNVARLQRLSQAKAWIAAEDLPYANGLLKRPGIKRWISMMAKTPQNLLVYEPNPKIGEVEVIPTPGHTPGHVCLRYRDVLFIGDLAAWRNEEWQLSASMMTWDQAQAKESIRKVNELNFRWICPAHGRPMERDESWGKFVSHLK